MKPILKKTERMLEVEQEFNEPLEGLLRRLFVDEEMNLYDLASHINVSYRIVLKWLKLCGVYSRRLGIND